jgi:NADH dehydrogenase FAD-containing subunit
MHASPTSETRQACDILILGAGYGGLLATLRLRRRRGTQRVILVNARERFVERVRLQEHIAAEIGPRIPSIAQLVEGRNVAFIRGEVVALEAERRVAHVASTEAEHEITFGEAIYALGSGVDTARIGGAGEHAFRLDFGDGPHGVAALRDRLRAAAGALRVTVIGGAESAIEAAAEIKTALPKAVVTMISGSRIGDFRGERVETALRAELARLGIVMIDGQSVTAIRADGSVTREGRVMPHDICVLASGLRSPTIAAEAGLATDESGRVLVGPHLRSLSHPHILAIGDAARPVAATGAPYRRSAFAALVSGAYAADEILAHAAGRELAPFSFSVFGQGVAVGERGVGFPSYPDERGAWFIIGGRLGLRVRNLFVRFLIILLRLERRFPGSFFWLGRRRVSRLEAEEAMREVTTA